MPYTTEEIAVAAHLNMTRAIVADTARRYPPHVDRAAMLSAAHLALLLATRKFDPDRGVALSVYAARRIRGALADEARADDWLGRGTRRRINDLHTVTAAESARLGRTPTTAELATAWHSSCADVVAVQLDHHRGVLARVDATALTRTDPQPGPGAVLVAREQIGYLREAVEELPEQMRTVINAELDHQSVGQIAAQLGVSLSRISQIRGVALTWLAAGIRTCQNPRRAPGDVGKRFRAYLGRCATTGGTLATRLAWTDIYGQRLSVGPVTR